MSLQPLVYLTRKETFSACHRLHSVHLSDEANKQTYGKCNNPNGHGHNYSVEVTIRGPVNPKTGMVMNLADLKDHIDHTIMKNLDHKNLDADVEYFRTKPSTTENVAIYIWENLKSRMNNPQLLFEVKINETEKNSVIYRGRLTSGRGDRRSSSNMNCATVSSDSD